MHAKIHHRWDALIAIIATQLVKEKKAYSEGHSVANITPNVKQLNKTEAVADPGFLKGGCSTLLRAKRARILRSHAHFGV